MEMLFKAPEIELQEIDSGTFKEHKIKLIIARLDKIHPIISGNKLFKLHYFLEKAFQTQCKTIITFGGAYSNHLLATAYSCKIQNLKSIGIVRGENIQSETLEQCRNYGMHLKYISREIYKTKSLPQYEDELVHEFGKCLIIPEGGYHPLGAKGASLIMDQVHSIKPTHICTAIGTATTMAGLIKKRCNNELIIGVPVLKGLNDISERLGFLTGKNCMGYTLFEDYHFGGYAKKNQVLIDFMNELYEKYDLPTDFVYTAKMMYAITDKIKSGLFPEASTIICLHTGGLQGNRTLPEKTLLF